MQDQKKDNRGAIWKNDRKEKDTQPDYKGKAMVNGVEYWVACWRKSEDANPNAPVLTYAFTPVDDAALKNQEKGNTYPDQWKKQQPQSADDEIPF